MPDKSDNAKAKTSSSTPEQVVVRREDDIIVKREQLSSPDPDPDRVRDFGHREANYPFRFPAVASNPEPRVPRKRSRSPSNTDFDRLPHHKLLKMADSPALAQGGISDPGLIKTVNKLQDVFTTVGVQNPIDLPQIVVVGSSGIVTRRPLVLQLINRPATNQTNGVSEEISGTTDKAANVDEWGEFLHIPGQKFYDFNKIRDEITRETEAKVGRNAGISPAPINLRVYSPNVLTLTLVDLPGLTKVPVGDQPRDIERQIRDMVLKYIQKSNAIILAVTSANTDLANSDGLKLAREVDPEGQRTIGVLTKVDLMDEGTDVVDILAGRIIPLRLGYVPVVNRGQRDIDNRKPISMALEAEKNFFENHKAYRNKSSYCGTPYLARKLNLILMMHIKQTLPDIKARIASSLQKYSAELESLGPSMLGNSANIVLNIITEFTNEYRTVLDGNSGELSSSELSGGARISFVFHELYSNGVKAVDPFDLVKDGDIRTILYNSSGPSPALFVGTTAFELIVKQQIKRLEEPSLKCASLIYDELVRILTQLLSKQLYRRYPQLKEKVHNVVVGFFKKAMEPTNKLVKDLVAMEACYINTGHPDFLNGHRAMAIVNERYNGAKPVQVDPKTGKPLPASATPARAASPSIGDPDSSNSGFFGSFFAAKNKKKAAAMEAPPPMLKASGTLSERENIEVEVIKLLISSYFNIVKRTMIDMVPKAIMLNLVAFTKDEMQRELLENMYRTDSIDDLLKESDYTVRRRKECQQMVESLSSSSTHRRHRTARTPQKERKVGIPSIRGVIGSTGLADDALRNDSPPRGLRRIDAIEPMSSGNSGGVVECETVDKLHYGVPGGGGLQCVEWERWPRAAALSEALWPERLRSKLAGRDVENGGDHGGDHDGGEMGRQGVIDLDDEDDFGYRMPESDYEFFDEDVDW
ncbi:hypothetical protein DL763_005957 [Monosporascus cannonballus]|nr:hypothetical protein DL763_005957 [Monosporascus cannonballus]